jgi:hypothetical protein
LPGYASPQLPSTSVAVRPLLGLADLLILDQHVEPLGRVQIMEVTAAVKGLFPGRIVVESSSSLRRFSEFQKIRRLFLSMARV